MFMISSQNMKQDVKGSFGEKVSGINLYNLSLLVQVINASLRTSPVKLKPLAEVMLHYDSIKVSM